MVPVRCVRNSPRRPGRPVSRDQERWRNILIWSSADASKGRVCAGHKQAPIGCSNFESGSWIGQPEAETLPSSTKYQTVQPLMTVR